MAITKGPPELFDRAGCAGDYGLAVDDEHGRGIELIDEPFSEFGAIIEVMGGQHVLPSELFNVLADHAQGLYLTRPAAVIEQVYLVHGPKIARGGINTGRLPREQA